MPKNLNVEKNHLLLHFPKWNKITNCHKIKCNIKAESTLFI